jgi:hypothetical protein
MSKFVLLLFSVLLPTALFSPVCLGGSVLMSLSVLLVSVLCYSAGSFIQAVPEVCSHEHFSSPLFSVLRFPQRGSFTSGLFLGGLMSLCQFLSVLFQPAAGSFTRLFLGVCPHDFFSLCLLLCACCSAGSFTRCPGVSAFMSLCSFSLSVFCLRFLQRWFFHQAVPECLLS